VIGEHGLCFVHGATPEAVAAARRKGGEASGESRREAAKRGRPLLQALAEEKQELWDTMMANYAGALEATFEDGRPDWRTRVMAQESLLAEIYGKPKQPTEELSRGVITIYRPAKDWDVDAEALPENVRPLRQAELPRSAEGRTDRADSS
jgi:hypothetical protein